MEVKTDTVSKMSQRTTWLLCHDCSVTKPKQLGAISHVKVPTTDDSNKPTWTSVYDPKDIESIVLHQHCQHFSQAHRTIFIVEPL